MESAGPNSEVKLARSGTPARRWRAIGMRLATVLMALGAGMMMGEALVRLTAPQSLMVPWKDEVNGITAARPNVHGRQTVPNTFDVEISINAQRFRASKVFSLAPPPRTLRLAVLGDSFTFGYGAEEEEAYPARLERILNEGLMENPDFDQVEIINAGVGGTGTGEQALWYEVWIKRFRPKVVILTVIPNDLEDDLAMNSFTLLPSGQVALRSMEQRHTEGGAVFVVRSLLNRTPGYAFLAQHSHLWALARRRLSQVIARNQGEAFAARFTQEGLPRMAGEVEWLATRVKDAGANLVVVFVPYPESVYDTRAAATTLHSGELSEAIVRTLAEGCERNQIPFLDLTPILRDRARQVDVPLYHSGMDNHPNPDGYHWIAQAVAEFVSAHELVPASPVDSNLLPAN